MTAPTQRVLPYLFYEDVGAALDWLSNAFGFREHTVETMRNDAGQVIHSAMWIEEAMVMMGMPTNHESPRKHGKVNSLQYVYVDDVDAHCARSRENGAVILSDLEDTFYGDRRYTAEDLEGHHWTFAQKVREVPPEQWNPSAEELKGHG